MALLTLGLTATSQEKPRAKWDNQTLRLASVSPVDQFKAVAKKEITCSRIDYSGTDSIFSTDAYIEVSSLRSLTINRYSVEAYFRMLRSLHCGLHPRYKKLKMGFGHTRPEDGVVSWVNGGYTVAYDINQSIEGTTTTGQKYEDYTIKRVTVLCIPDGAGNLVVKIIAITVESTTP